MNINHQIFETLNNIKTPEGGLSLVPMDDSRHGYHPENEAGVVRIWGADNGFASKATLEKSNIKRI